MSFFTTPELYLFGEKSDTLRNRFLRLQRAGYITHMDLWLSARLLRNRIARACICDELKELLESLKKTLCGGRSPQRQAYS